jgi:sulfide:quinone oxidoreductase
VAPDAPARVTIAGGGVAALEGALAVRDLAGERVELTIVAPDERFTYRPLSVNEPFALGQEMSVPLEEIARDLGATLVRDALASVQASEHEAGLAGGERVPYDMLLVAVGARRAPAFDHATTFRGQEDAEPVHGLIQDLEGGYARRIAFVVPPGVAWPLPLYELALMSAQRAYEMSIDDVELTVVTPEETPLAVFGPTASAGVAELLGAAGIRVETSARAEVPDQRTVVLHPGDRVVSCDRVVALPTVQAIAIEGLPRDGAGFTPVDAHGRVRGLAGVYAAGDGTAFPVKQGGLACQQADAAAASIAGQAGAGVEARPFKPVLRGELLTGSRPLFLRSDISGTAGDRSESSGHTLWWPPAKIAGDYLAPYLEEREQPGAEHHVPHMRHSRPVAAALAQGHGVELLGFEDVGDGPAPDPERKAEP